MKWFMILCCTVLLGVVPVSNYQNEISKNVIRFHVIANSNTLRDQQLKLKVRDEILKYLSEITNDCQSLESTKAVLVKHMDEIKDVAYNAVGKSGEAYKVVVRFSEKYFPEKNYGDITFPRGYYEALTVEIGSGVGRNWWCVLFPNLCFTDAVTAKVPKESKVLLEEQLPKDVYEALIQGEKVQIRFKIAQFITDLFSE